MAVVGSGYMGGGIAQVLALAGNTVYLADVSLEVTEKNYRRLIDESKDFVAAGLFPEGATATLERNLVVAASVEEAVADADFIEEAVPEVLAIKHEILARISAASRPDAIIGSNTSTIAIGDMATAVTHPERFLGVHFSNPSPFIPGVEVIPHAGTVETVVTAAREIVHSTGKQTAVDTEYDTGDPRRLVGAHVQIGLQRRQRDDDDRDVERYEEDPEGEREQRHVAVLAHRGAP